MKIKVKHILEILKKANSEFEIDFYNFGTNFNDADLAQLDFHFNEQEKLVNIFINETKEKEKTHENKSDLQA